MESFNYDHIPTINTIRRKGTPPLSRHNELQSTTDPTKSLQLVNKQKFNWFKLGGNTVDTITFHLTWNRVENGVPFLQINHDIFFLNIDYVIW